MWASARKTIYALVLVFGIVVLGIYGFRDTLFPTPVCNDNKQNGYEEGVDCGGVCARKCADQVMPLTVVWARALLVEDGVYDLAGMISNRNPDSTPFNLDATFTVYNAKAEIIFSKKIGVLPPSTGDLPIMIQSVRLKDIPSKVVITLGEGSSYKTSKAMQSVQISVINSSFETTNVQRAYVVIRNLTRNRFINFPVRVVLYDADQNAIGVGETFVEALDKEEDKTLVFTWKNNIPRKPLLIKAYPVLYPF